MDDGTESNLFLVGDELHWICGSFHEERRRNYYNRIFECQIKPIEFYFFLFLLYSMNSSLLLHDLIPEDIWINQLIPLLGLRACCRGTFVSKTGYIRFKKQVSINSLVLRVPEDIVNLNEAIAVYETYLRPQRSAAYEQKWKDAPEEHDNEEQTRPCDI